MARAKFAPKRLLIVHAHPDDESLFTGHIIADRLAAKAEVYVFTLTRGERGKMKLEELKSLEGNFSAMGSFRATELAEALAVYGKVEHSFAGTRAYLDSGLRINPMGKPAKPRNLDEMALSAAATSVIADDIAAKIQEFKPANKPAPAASTEQPPQAPMAAFPTQPPPIIGQFGNAPTF